MLRGFHPGVDLVDGAILINKVGDPVDACVFPPHELLGTPHAVDSEHSVALVAQHGEGKVVFLHTVPLFLWGIGADADDLNVLLRILLEFITEFLALGDSAGGIGFGKEPQD